MQTHYHTYFQFKLHKRPLWRVLVLPNTGSIASYTFRSGPPGGSDQSDQNDNRFEKVVLFPLLCDPLVSLPSKQNKRIKFLPREWI